MGTEDTLINLSGHPCFTVSHLVSEWVHLGFGVSSPQQVVVDPCLKT